MQTLRAGSHVLHSRFLRLGKALSPEVSGVFSTAVTAVPGSTVTILYVYLRLNTVSDQPNMLLHINYVTHIKQVRVAWQLKI